MELVGVLVDIVRAARHPLLAGCVLALGFTAGARPGEAQVGTAITSSGLGTVVTPPLPGETVHRITGGTRPAGPSGPGPNLFHSFGRFGIGAGDTALFGNTTPGIRTERILGRVTGGELTRIFGTVDTLEFPGAALYLINPSGFVFGPGAALNVSGSFHAVSADYVRFADGAQFSADPARPTVLTVAPPIAFGFLGPRAGPITVEGTALQVPEGHTLSLVGGDTRITASILGAPSGVIQIVSVGSGGEVLLRPAPASGVDVASFTRLGRIDITQGSILDASDVSGLGSGSLVIRGRGMVLDGSGIVSDTSAPAGGATGGIDLDLSDELLVVNGSVLRTSTFGAAPGADVRISTGAMHVDGSLVQTQSSGEGGPGAMVLRVGSLSATGGAAIGVSSAGVGPSGNVSIHATGDVTISGRDLFGSPSQLFTETQSAGDGGRLGVSAASLTMSDSGSIASRTFGGGRGGDLVVGVDRMALTSGAQISSLTGSTARGGDVSVTAREAAAISGVAADGTETGVFASAIVGGQAGDMTLHVGRLDLGNGAQIRSGSPFDPQGGNVRITATGPVVISGESGVAVQAFAADVGRLEISTPELIMDGGFLRTSTLEAHRGGDIVATLGTLTMRNGAQMASSSELLASGRGGDINVTATGTASISGASSGGRPSGLFSRAESMGPAGAIALSAPALTLTDGATISVSTSGAGPAGNVSLAVGSLGVAGGARIDSSTDAAGPGGSVRVIASNAVSLAGRSAPGGSGLGGSGLFSTAQGIGDAGQIIIEGPPGAPPPVVSLADGARISVATLSTGKAGDIDVRASHLTFSGGARIDSGTSGDGQGGTARVVATETIEISGRGIDGAQSGIVSNAAGRGAAGQVAVSAPVLTMVDGALSAQTLGAGRAGNVAIDVGRLQLTGGAQMDSTTFGEGAGGAIAINASESVHIAGAGGGMRSNAMGAGGAGEIAINTPALVMTEGAVVAAETSGTGAAGNIRLVVGTASVSGGSRVTSSALRDGQGGAVTVVGGDLVTLSSGVLSTTAAGSRPGGDIDVSASRIVLTDRTEVTATSTGRGDAGSIRMTARDSLVSQGSRVETNSASGTGGNVDIFVAELLRLIDSEVTATAIGGDRRGGNITIGAPAAISGMSLVSALGDGASGPGATPGRTDFVLLERSRIRANAFGGPGGNVQINAGIFLQTDSQITASSALGVQGTVDVNAQITDVSGTIAALPETVLQAAALLRDSCAARVSAGKASSLALGSRDGLPWHPGGIAASPLTADDSDLAGKRGTHDSTLAMASRRDGDHVAPPRLTLRCFR